MAHRTDIGIRERRTYLLMVFLYLTIRWTRSAEIGPELLHSYGGDILFIPILMTSIKVVRQLFNFSFGIGKKEVAAAVVYSSVVFEWVLPNEGTNFVSDPLDIVAYVLGAVIYTTMISKSTQNAIRIKRLLSQ